MQFQRFMSSGWSCHGNQTIDGHLCTTQNCLVRHTCSDDECFMLCFSLLCKCWKPSMAWLSSASHAFSKYEKLTFTLLSINISSIWASGDLFNVKGAGACSANLISWANQVVSQMYNIAVPAVGGYQLSLSSESVSGLTKYISRTDRLPISV